MSPLDPNRRELLLAAAAAATLTACPGGDDDDSALPGPDPAPDVPVEPAPWGSAPGTLDGALFPLGVQSGDPLPDAAIVWTKYVGAAALTLTVVGEGDGWEPVREQGVTPDDVGVVKLDVSGLQPGRSHRYVFTDADGRRSRVGRFRTAPAAEEWRRFVFGATSCTKQNHAPFPCLSAAAAEELEFFLLLGDTVYCDDSNTPPGYQECWAENLGTAGYLDLRASTPTIMTWDDHEVTNVNGGTWDVNPARWEAASGEFWRHNSIRPQAELGRVWRRFTYGTVVDLFVLDCRQERDPDAGLYVSRAQMDWLKAGLAESTAALKIIMNSVPMAHLAVGQPLEGVYDLVADDRWQGFPEQRAEILDHILGEAIDGVLWVSGDVHFGAVTTLELEGPWAGHKEVIAGPGGHSLSIFELLEEREPFLRLVGPSNWVRFDVDPGLGTVDLTFVGDDGGSLANLTLALSELSPR